MKLIAGLGNPGPEYQFSPHNAGFAVLDRLAERHAVRWEKRLRGQARCGHLVLGQEPVWLLQPQTFMNLSGAAVKQWLKLEECGPGDLVVIADDLDLPFGAIRIRQTGGSAGHHGLESIIDAIGTKDFTRMRIGVDPGHVLEDPVSYLLRPLRGAQKREMEQCIERAADAAQMIVGRGAAKAMNQFNRRELPQARDEQTPGELPPDMKGNENPKS